MRCCFLDDFETLEIYVLVIFLLSLGGPVPVKDRRVPIEDFDCQLELGAIDVFTKTYALSVFI